LRKLIAISLLSIHLVNLTGQLALYQYLIYRSDVFFNKQIDKNRYNINDLTEIKLQIKQPGGFNDWKNYQNICGRLQFKNSAYNYVKMKITASVVYLMCVPNYKTTHLSNQNIINARQIPDIPVPKKEHVPFGKLNLITYSYQAIRYWFRTPVVEMNPIISCNHSFVLYPGISEPGQPPEIPALIS
jgi:hypothetical protein